MQKVVKVSIANIAFTLEQDAHELMRDYLERLQIHYESSPNCGEILSEIESRIAELLSERGYRDKVVPPETVQEIIDILGRPEDFDSEAESGEQPRNRKRVFRDPDNKILGGVCGGLGAYFSVDPLIFRIAFAVWVFFFFWLEVFKDWGWGMSVLGMFAYVILWISMPEARTVEQRYNMKGGSVSLKNIQKTVEKEAKDVSRKVSRGVKEGVRSTGGFWKALGRCFGIIFGALFFLTGMAGCAASLLAVFGIGIWNGLHAFGTSWFLSVITDAPAWVSVLISVLTCITVILPFIGLLYAGILILFRLKSPRWKPGLIIFIVWVVSLLGLIGVSAGSLSTVRSMDCSIHESRLPVRDTLFIEFAGCSQWKDFDVLVDAGRNSYDLLYMGRNGSDPCLVIYPDLYVGTTKDSVSKVVSYAKYVTEGMNLNDLTEKKSSKFWSFDADSRTLRIEPIIFSSDIRTTDINRQMRVFLKKGTCVIVREPVRHEFDSNFEYCSSRFLKIVEELR